MDPDPDEAIVLEQVRALLGDLGGDSARPITLESDLVVDLDLDSLALVELLDRVERALSVTFDDAVLGSARTVRDWIDALSRARGGSGGPEPETDRVDLPRSAGVHAETDRPAPFSRDVRAGGDVRVDGDGRGSSPPDRPPRTAFDLAYGLFVSVAAIVIALPLLVVLHLPVSLASRWRFVRCGVRALRWVAGVAVSVEGDLPVGPGGLVLVANHGSFLDGFVMILASAEPLIFVTSAELARVPLVGGFLRRLGCVFVARGRAEAATDAVSGLLDPLVRQRRLFVFPEGGLDPAPGVRPFRLGAFNVAVTIGAPVVPVGIDGTRAMLPPGAHLARRGTVRIRVGERIEPVGAGFASQVALRDQARSAVEELVRTGEP